MLRLQMKGNHNSCCQISAKLAQNIKVQCLCMDYVDAEIKTLQSNNNSNILSMQNLKNGPFHFKGSFLKSRLKTDSQRQPNAYHSKNSKLDGLIRIRSIGYDQAQHPTLLRSRTPEHPFASVQHTVNLKRNSLTQELQKQMQQLNKSNVQFGRWEYSPVQAGRGLNISTDIAISKQFQRKNLKYRHCPKTINVRLVERLLLTKFTNEMDNKGKQRQTDKHVSHRIHDSYSKIMKTLHRKKWIG